jgi:predicted transcriptional regulator
MNEDEHIDELIDDLVTMGALIKNDKPVNGEITYNINPERMQEVMPSFHELFMEEVEETMLDLYEQGLVRVEYDENLRALYSLTEEGEAVVNSIILSDRPYDV